MSPPTYDPTWCDIQPVPTNEEAIVYARNAFSLRCIGCWLGGVCVCNMEVLFCFELNRKHSSAVHVMAVLKADLLIPNEITADGTH